METHLIFRSSTSSVVFVMLFNQLLHELEARSAKGLFLGINPAGYKVLDLQSKVAYVAGTVKVFDGKFLSTEENQILVLCRERNQYTQLLWILRLQDLRILTSRSQRKKILCRLRSRKNASTSRSGTGRHSRKHPGQRECVSRICRSEKIWSLDGFNARRAIKCD